MINAIVVPRLPLAGFYTDTHDIVVLVETVLDDIDILLVSLGLDEINLLLNFWLNSGSVRLRKPSTPIEIDGMGIRGVFACHGGFC